QLWTASNVLIAITSPDVNGAYAFGNLPPGFYRVVHIAPVNYVNVAAFPGGNGSLINSQNLQVTVIAGVNSGNNNFLDRIPAPGGGGGGQNTISGTAVRDLDQNGVPNNEPGLAGMTIVLRNSFSTVIGTFVTDVTGSFSFS